LRSERTQVNRREKETRKNLQGLSVYLKRRCAARNHVPARKKTNKIGTSLVEKTQQKKRRERGVLKSNKTKSKPDLQREGVSRNNKSEREMEKGGEGKKNRLLGFVDQEFAGQNRKVCLMDALLLPQRGGIGGERSRGHVPKYPRYQWWGVPLGEQHETLSQI